MTEDKQCHSFAVQMFGHWEGRQTEHADWLTKMYNVCQKINQRFGQLSLPLATSD